MSDPQQRPIPDILYKYVDAKGGLATLEGEKVSVMFSKPSDLNDPFEFLPSLNGLSCDPSEFKPECRHLASPILSANADYWRHEIELHWFVTSLTTADRNVRMWAQYAGNHSGIKLTFNLAEIATQKGKMGWVEYLNPNRVDIRQLSKLTDQVQKGNLLKQLATRKGEDWTHEEEVRWFLRDEDGHQADKAQQSYSKGLVDGKMRAFMKLPHSCIEQVTVGYLSDPSLLRTVLELRKMHKANWKVAKAILSLSSFRFDEDSITEE